MIIISLDMTKAGPVRFQPQTHKSFEAAIKSLKDHRGVRLDSDDIKEKARRDNCMIVEAVATWAFGEYRAARTIAFVDIEQQSRMVAEDTLRTG